MVSPSSLVLRRADKVNMKTIVQRHIQYHSWSSETNRNSIAQTIDQQHQMIRISMVVAPCRWSCIPVIFGITLHIRGMTLELSHILVLQ